MTEATTTFIANLFRPIFVPISHWLLSPKRPRPTWHYETAFVALILVTVAVCTTPNPFLLGSNTDILRQFLIIWLSAAAVIGSFLHAKVGYLMSEAMVAAKASDESCHEWLGSYWLWKEVLWFAVFLISGAYPALAGNVIFLLYPAWRKVHVEERAKLRSAI